MLEAVEEDDAAGITVMDLVSGGSKELEEPAVEAVDFDAHAEGEIRFFGFELQQRKNMMRASEWVLSCVEWRR